MSYRQQELKHRLPAWWQKTRSLYCPLPAGAGSALMSFGIEFNTSDKSREEIDRLIESSKKPDYTNPKGSELNCLAITDQIKSFTQLPEYLHQARRVNTNLIYLADYWEGGYFNKGDYIPRPDLGGPEAFREGIKAIHELGGKIIIYLEPFIVSRQTSRIGREKGKNWAIMDRDGKHYPYYMLPIADYTYYIMWPGKGSGWSKYLADLAEHMLVEYDVDGFHLDDYGFVQGWMDHHPDHTDGLEPGEFDVRAVDMVYDFCKRVKDVKPEAVVMMEGSEREDLMAACDGAQHWLFSYLSQKPWFREKPYKIFTSEFSLPQMEKILASGYNVSIAHWWLQPVPDQQMIDRLKKAEISPVGNSWIEQTFTRNPVRDLWWCYNVLFANGLATPKDIYMEWLKEKVPPFPLPCDPYLDSDEGKSRWKSTVSEVLSGLEKMDLKNAVTPAQYLGKLISKAEKNLLAI